MRVGDVHFIDTLTDEEYTTNQTGPWKTSS
jgi:hypothetical protein